MGNKKVQNNGYKFVKNNGMPVRRESQKQVFIHHSKAETADPTNGHASVDDATWDKIVMDLMEEYDEAWTQLADR